MPHVRFGGFGFTSFEQLFCDQQVPLHLPQHHHEVHIRAQGGGRRAFAAFAPFPALIEMVAGWVVVLSDRRRRSQAGRHHPSRCAQPKKQLNTCTSSAHQTVITSIHHPEAGWSSADDV